MCCSWLVFYARQRIRTLKEENGTVAKMELFWQNRETNDNHLTCLSLFMGILLADNNPYYA